LIANSAGLDHHITTIDSLLAVALTLRGADVHILLCDEALPACVMSHSKRVPADQFVKSGPAEHLCGRCFLPGAQVFQSLGLPIHRYGELTTPEDRSQADALVATVPTADIATFRLDGMEIGEHALAGALRYFARGDLRDEPHGEAVLRRYFRASLLSMCAIRRLLGTLGFRSVCSLQGMYVPDGVIGEVARRQNVRPVCWNEGYRKHTFIFSHHDTYHRTMLCESSANWEGMPWTDEMELDILEYLKSRWYGTHDWIGYTQDWSEDVATMAAGLGIDFSKPCIGLLTNVIWDAQVHYGGNAFPNMLEWTLETIKYFARRPDLQLIVRIHPAEVRGAHRSRQLMVDEIERAIPDRPKNVFVIPPDSRMNTYAAMLKCNAAIIYGTKVGVELSSFGVPIIVAGEAWIRNKGLTLDASSAREYFDILDRLPLRERMSAAAVRQARKYAYHFFFRRLIPLPFLRHTTGDALFKLEVSGLDDLLPGRQPGLDVICDGIVNGDEFIYPAELYPGHVAGTGKFTTSYSATHPAKSSHRPLVSVVIPTHNHADSLAERLDSVFAQEGAGTHFDVEVIVVDNASSNGTASVASRYNGVHYIGLETPAPLATVRNLGVKASKGKYVAFLEDDDRWAAARLRSQVVVLEGNPDFGAVYGQFIAADGEKEALWPDAATAPAGSVWAAFLTDEYALPSFLTVRRDAYEQAGDFDEALGGMETYDMALRLACFVRFAFVSGPVGIGRFSKESTWSRRIQQGQYHSELPYILRKAFVLLPATADVPALKRKVLSRWFTEIGQRLDKPDTVGLLRAHVLHSIRENPWLLVDSAARPSLLAYGTRVLSRTLCGWVRSR
jgi:glycosyltransferase involved in cell wall biosynthesis